MTRAPALLAVVAVVWAVFAVGGGQDGSTECIPGQCHPINGTDPSADIPATLNYGPIYFEGNANYLYRDNDTACQVVISDSTSDIPARLITAFPNGNSGALTYFVPVGGVLGVTLVNGSLASVSGNDGQVGITGTLSMSGDAELGTTIIGSVRTVRDYVEGGGVMHQEFNYTLGDYNDTSVQLVRHWLNGTTVQLFTLSAGDNLAIDVQPSNNEQPPGVHLQRQDKSQNGTLTFTSTLNFTTTTPETPYVEHQGLGRGALFRTDEPSDPALQPVIQAIHSNATSVVDQMSFLAYADVFFAGGWRFLTYFGRDTLFTLQLLMPVMSEQAAEAVLAAVIQRTNATSGELCHEETVGDYASFLHMQDGHPELGNTPIYVYTMTDTDFLLLPVLADYLTSDRGSARAADFLGRNSTLVPGSFTELLLHNVDNVLHLTQAFTDNPTKENLVRIRSYPVGNWRDSNAGLGWGAFPFDVNCAFIPAALGAISRLAEANLIPEEYKNASSAAKVWEDNACPMFAVDVSAQDAGTRLAAYVQQANLTDALLYGAGALNESQTTSPNESYAWNDPTQIIGGQADSSSTLFAVSLMDDASPVGILNSDLSFALLYSNNISTDLIQATVEALQPYPRGLLTNVGMVVANAAYDTNTTRIPEFSDAAYHGAVSWSWTQAMMAAGVARQLSLCDEPGDDDQGAGNQKRWDHPAWCATHATSLRKAQTRLWDAIAGSADVLWTEVWSPVFSAENGTFAISDLGTRGGGTEGDAVQLWSYGFLGLVDPRSGRPVAEGWGNIGQ